MKDGEYKDKTVALLKSLLDTIESGGECTFVLGACIGEEDEAHLAFGFRENDKDRSVDEMATLFEMMDEEMMDDEPEPEVKNVVN